MKHSILLAAFFIILLSKSGYAEPEFVVKVSKPSDGFAIGIPKHWNEQVTPSEKGTTYAYWDNIGNALTITVREPNSFKKLLEMVKNGKINKEQLKKFERVFAKEAPLKQKLKIDIEVISNQKALTQSYIYRHETTGLVYFLKNKQFEFIKNNKQYQVSFSPQPTKTIEAAELMFNNSYWSVFQPILVTLFLN